MQEKNIVVLISGSGSNLQAFIDAEKAGTLGGKIVGVISNKPDVYGLVRAEQAAIATQVINHKDFASREAFDQHLAELIKSYQPDLVILAGFMRILTADFVGQFKNKLLNIHPSLLPKFTGLHTHRRALEAREEFHGSSVHFVTEELDGGPVIAQARMKLNHQLDENTVMQLVQKMEHKLYPQVAAWILQGRIVQNADGIFFDQTKLQQPLLIDES